MRFWAFLFVGRLQLQDDSDTIECALAAELQSVFVNGNDPLRVGDVVTLTNYAPATVSGKR